MDIRPAAGRYFLFDIRPALPVYAREGLESERSLDDGLPLVQMKLSLA